MSEAKEAKEIVYSNVSVVREQDGRHSVYVGSTKVIGITNATMQTTQDGTGVWSFVIPSARVRLAEGEPTSPVLQASAEVIQYPKMHALRVVDTPQDMPA